MLFGLLRCIDSIFCDLFADIHNVREHIKRWPDWHPKWSLFTPVGSELKYLWQCASSTGSLSRKLKEGWMWSLLPFSVISPAVCVLLSIGQRVSMCGCASQIGTLNGSSIFQNFYNPLFWSKYLWIHLQSVLKQKGLAFKMLLEGMAGHQWGKILHKSWNRAFPAFCWFAQIVQLPQLVIVSSKIQRSRIQC